MDTELLNKAKEIQEGIKNLEAGLRVIDGVPEQFIHCHVGTRRHDLGSFWVESAEIGKLILAKERENRVKRIEELKSELEKL